MWINYLVIFIILLLLELIYFNIADYFNIIDRPNERSSHTTIVLRGGGIIFPLSMFVWTGFQIIHGDFTAVENNLPFLIGLIIIAGISFWDDIKSLPDSVRLVAQFLAMGLMFWNLGIMHWDMWWIVLIALVVFVGATNIINFMDGINGITAGYSFAVLIPLFLLNNMADEPFVLNSILGVAILAVLVFSFFNFRPRGKAKCFAGDVGSVGIAFIMLFALGKLIMATNDLTWLSFIMVYGVDGCLTIIHRIMLRENLGQAHRKHAYQLMANEVGMSHVVVSLIYMGLQLSISLIMVCLIPNTQMAHWIYFVVVAAMLSVAYILFMKKYYHLHEAYLASLEVRKEGFNNSGKRR